MTENPPIGRLADAVVNPTIVLAIGELGHAIALQLESRVHDLTDVHESWVVRNLGILRVLTASQLRNAEERGLPPGMDRNRRLWFEEPPGDPVDLRDAFGTGETAAGEAFVGASFKDDERRNGAADALLAESLKRLIQTLFRVDRFVDYTPDDDRFAARLDVIVCGSVEDPLVEATTCGVQRLLSEMVEGPLKPLFRPHYSNLSITNLLGLPLLEDWTRREAARRVVTRHRGEADALSRKGWVVPARFLFLDDRTMRYVVTQEQMVAAMTEYIRLMTMRRAGSPEVLRDLAQPLPAKDRLRKVDRPLNHNCGMFSIAVAEVPVERVVRYCRNRQSLAVLNTYLRRKQDLPPGAGSIRVEDEVGKVDPDAPTLLGDDPEDSYEARAIRTDERREMYEADGVIESELDAFIEKHVHQEILVTLEPRIRQGIGELNLREIAYWEHQDGIVPPFHGDLDPNDPSGFKRHHPFFDERPGGRGRPFTKEWIDGLCGRIRTTADMLTKLYIPGMFEEVEEKARKKANLWVRQEKERIDVLLDGEPSGWKTALKELEAVLSMIDLRIEHWTDKVGAIKFGELQTQVLEKRGRSALAELVEAVDAKALGQRAGWMGRSLGLAGGVGLGVLLAALLAKHAFVVAGMNWTLLPSMALLVWLTWWLIWRDNAVRVDAINEIIRPGVPPEWQFERPKNPGTLRSIVDQQIEVLFHPNPKGGRSWIGDRLNWSKALWKLRIWKRIRLELQRDRLRLEGIGLALDRQVTAFRRDQESLRVRFRQSHGDVLEDLKRAVFSQGIFDQSLVSAEALDVVYGLYAEPHDSYSEGHLGDEVPFDAWRDFAPFAEKRPMGSYCRRPFDDLLGIDFFQIPQVEGMLREELKGFLGDFVHKLSIQGDGEGIDGSDREHEELMVLTHSAHADVVGELVPGDELARDWVFLPDLPRQNAVIMLRHVQGLAPWEIEALGTPRDLVQSLVASGRMDALPGLVGSMEEMGVRLVFAAHALAEVTRPEGAGATDEAHVLSSGRRMLCREVLRSARADGSRGVSPVDGQGAIPMDGMEGDEWNPFDWVELLKGEEGLLPLIVTLYGTCAAPPDEAASTTLLREKLMRLAAQNQPDWTRRVLHDLPSDWIGVRVAELVEVEWALDQIAQHEDDVALAGLGRIEWDALRTSAMLRAAARWVEAGRAQPARSLLVDTRFPLDSGSHLLPAHYDIRRDQAEALVAALSPHEGLGAALLIVLGRRSHRPDDAEADWRVGVVSRAYGPHGAVSALRETESLPVEHLDPQFTLKLREGV